jgi:hypothetical protein
MPTNYTTSWDLTPTRAPCGGARARRDRRALAFGQPTQPEQPGATPCSRAPEECEAEDLPAAEPSDLRFRKPRWARLAGGGLALALEARLPEQVRLTRT